MNTLSSAAGSLFCLDSVLTPAALHGVEAMPYDAWKLSNGETAEDLRRTRLAEQAEFRVGSMLGVWLDEVVTDDFNEDGEPELTVRIASLPMTGDGDECQQLIEWAESLAKRLKDWQANVGADVKTIFERKSA